MSTENKPRPKFTCEFIGFDDWSRALIKTAKGTTLCDTNCHTLDALIAEPDLGDWHTITADWGEPLSPVLIEVVNIIATTDDMDHFIEAYIECAIWASNDNSREDGGDPLDANYDADDIDPDALMQMKAECSDFFTANKDALDRACQVHGATMAQHGHDFWLTRNGHGAGFWDRGYGDLGGHLSELCRPYGSSDLYVGDDGKIHVL